MEDGSREMASVGCVVLEREEEGCGGSRRQLPEAEWRKAHGEG